MLNVVQQAIVDHLEAEKAARIPGLLTVQFGDAPVPTELLPVVTVDWDGKVRPKFNGSHFEVTADFAITVYACSMESEAVADAAVNDLVLKADEDRWTGVAPVLAKLTGYTDDNGQKYRLQLIGDVLTGSLKKSGVYESIAVITLRVETWLNKDQF